MDALATDHHRAALRWQWRAVDVFEMRNRLTTFVVDPRAALAEDHLIGTRTRDKSVEQHHLQIAAVDGKLRHAVASKAPGRLAIDVLAEAIVKAIFARGDGDLGQRILQAEPAQLARGMRQDVDADADRLELGC